MSMTHPNGLAPDRPGARAVRIDRFVFGETPKGTPVQTYTMTNARGMEVEVIDYGGIVRALRVPDHEGRVEDVVLGYGALDSYLENPFYFGAVIGRVANRIRDGQFPLDGTTYTLACNEGDHHLHGGDIGFDSVVWESEPFQEMDRAGVILTHTSSDGDEGYPGTLRCRVVYALTRRNELIVEYRAETDKSTPVNLTHHSYFNLRGQGNGTILDHTVRIEADQYTPIDDTHIPTGDVKPVDGTPLDFRTAHPLGKHIDAGHPQTVRAAGYDHNFVLCGEAGTLRPAAHVLEPETGRVLDVATTEPGLQLYTGDFLEPTTGKQDASYEARSGFCLETQHFPDAPNQPQFPSTVLRPGEIYRSTTVFSFSVQSSSLSREAQHHE